MANQPVTFDWEGFDWDKGNIGKNWIRHRVGDSECEQVFFNQPLIILPDVKHSSQEDRFYLLGQTDAGRCLFLAFSVRRKLVRVISARDMNRKERKEYKNEETTPKV
jgi:hypothetical protein